MKMRRSAIVWPLLAVAIARMFKTMCFSRLASLLARRARDVGVLAGLWWLSWPAEAAAKTLYFPHQDAHFLHRFQRNGGAAVVPERAGSDEPLPILVFLHGTNSTSEPHMWLGGGGKDLRPLVKRLVEGGQVEPFVLAAPSHTRHAGLAATVWQGFNLNAFVDDVVHATQGQVIVDRTRVVLAGHSGAGCNPQGGLAADYWSAGAPLPLALVSIDPCWDRKMGRRVCAPSRRGAVALVVATCNLGTTA